MNVDRFLRVMFHIVLPILGVVGTFTIALGICLYMEEQPVAPKPKPTKLEHVEEDGTSVYFHLKRWRHGDSGEVSQER